MKKELILKSNRDIKDLFENGKSISNGVILSKILESNDLKFLFAVSSKKFKRAVDRNRIKRLMREVVRKSDINGFKIAFIYNGNSLPSYLEVESSIKNIIEKINNGTRKNMEIS